MPAHALAADDKTAGPPPAAESAANLTAKPGFDIDGDPLPPGVIARLGTKHFRTCREKNGHEPNQLAFLPDNHTLVQVTSDGLVQQWDALTGRQLPNNPSVAKPISTAASSADGRMLAIGGGQVDEATHEFTNSFRLIDATTGNERLKWEVAGRITRCLALSPDGGTAAWENEDQVHVLSVAAQSEVATQQTGPGEVSPITFSPDGKTLAIGKPGKILLWNWASKDEPRSIFVGGNPRFSSSDLGAISFSPDGSHLVVGGDDSIGILLYASDGHLVRTFNLPDVESWNLHGVAFSPDGRLLAVPLDELNSGWGIALWEVATGKLVHRLRGLQGTASAVAFSADGKLLAAKNFWDMTLCVWNVATGKPIDGDWPGHVEPPHSLRFFDHDRQLASAGDDGTIRIWNLADSRQIRMIAPQPDLVGERWIRAMDVSADGKYIASSSFDDTVRVWDAATGREIYRFPGHGRFGGHRALRFTPDSRQLASWGDDMRVSLWDMATGKALQDYFARPDGNPLDRNQGNHPFAPGGTQIDDGRFSPDAGTLMVGINSGNIYRFSVKDGKEVNRFGRAGGGMMMTRFDSSADGEYLLATNWRRSQVVRLPDGRVKGIPTTAFPVELWSIGNERIVGNCELPGAGADCVSLSPTVAWPQSPRLGTTHISNCGQFPICKAPVD